MTWQGLSNDKKSIFSAEHRASERTSQPPETGRYLIIPNHLWRQISPLTKPWLDGGDGCPLGEDDQRGFHTIGARREKEIWTSNSYFHREWTPQMREYVGSGLASGRLSHSLARDEFWRESAIAKNQHPLTASDNELVTPRVLHKDTWQQMGRRVSRVFATSRSAPPKVATKQPTHFILIFNFFDKTLLRPPLKTSKQRGPPIQFSRLFSFKAASCTFLTSASKARQHVATKKSK